MQIRWIWLGVLLACGGQEGDPNSDATATGVPNGDADTDADSDTDTDSDSDTDSDADTDPTGPTGDTFPTRSP